MRHFKGKSRSYSAMRNVRRLKAVVFSLHARTTFKEIPPRSAAWTGAEKDLGT